VEVLGRKVQSVAPLRANLIKKGMVWNSPSGDAGFTASLFDGLMKRVVPKD
jgi:hypothetical protein